MFRIPDAEQQADYSISNDGTLADLHEAIDKLINDEGLIGSGFRQPD